jgi:probable F420-dependent oxidoreductase
LGVPFVVATHLLANTERLVVAIGVANIWKREPLTMMGGARSVAEFFPDRFILGLGVAAGSFMHRHGLAYDKPYSTMRTYLAKMKTAPYSTPCTPLDPPVVLGALLPKMLQLAAEETHGTITGNTPPERIAAMRAMLGPNPWICAGQFMLLETDATIARAAARRVLNFYLNSDGYQKNLRLLGYGDDDFANGGSDRLVDVLFAWGDEQRLRAAIAAHVHAGANQVVVVPLRTTGVRLPDEQALAMLAPHESVIQDEHA